MEKFHDSDICRRLDVGQGKRVSLSDCLLLKITIFVAFCAPRPDVSIVLVLPPAPAGQLWMIRRHKMQGALCRQMAHREMISEDLYIRCGIGIL